MKSDSEKKIVEIKRKKCIQIVNRACKTHNLPLPHINFEGCSAEDGNQLAHYHPDTNKICISERQLYMQNFDDLEDTMTHEVTHILIPGHDTDFHNLHGDIKSTTWQPEGSAVRINGGARLDESDKPSKSLPPDKNSCNYHLCENKGVKLSTCSYCKGYYCIEHLKPIKPDFIESIDDLDINLDDIQGHPCPDYPSKLAEKEYIQRDKYDKVLDTLSGKKTKNTGTSDAYYDTKKSPFYVQEKYRKEHVGSEGEHTPPKVQNKYKRETIELDKTQQIRKCDYCGITLSESYLDAGTCSKCNKEFCTYHIEPKNHKCSAVDWEGLRKQEIAESEARWESFKANRERNANIKLGIEIILVLLILGVFFYSLYFGLLAPPGSCGVGRYNNTCLNEKPYFCSNGKLNTSATMCGCPQGYVIFGEKCIIPSNCSDDTVHNSCSEYKPYFCNNGELVYNATQCGCYPYQLLENTTCRNANNCADGTKHNSCSSINKSLFCYDGTLTENISVCGCEDGQIADNNTCRLSISCSDGTLDMNCTANNPNYCYNGTIIQKASVCGCPEDFEADGESCKKIVKCTDGTKDGECSIHKPLICSNGELALKESYCGYYQDQYTMTYGSGDSTVSAISISELEQLIHTGINSQRHSNGLSSLQLDSSLSSIARHHSQDMADNNYFEHTNLHGQDPSARASAAGYTCHKSYGSYYTDGIGENIYQTWTYSSTTYYAGVTSYDYSSISDIANQVVSGWMGSPGHRQNILTSTYDREGMGVAITSEGEIYVTEDFC